MFSQRDEEIHIVEYFKNRVKEGRFLDIGAYDGITFSNIRQLALNGWGGVLIEPMIEMHDVLEELYNSSRFTILYVGVGLKNEMHTFYNFAGDAIGSFDKEHADIWVDKARPYTEVQYEIISVESLFDRVGWEFDFINIDAEGWSIQILKSLPFDKLDRVKMICIEFDSQANQVLKFMKEYRFTELHRTAENLILVRECI